MRTYFWIAGVIKISLRKYVVARVRTMRFSPNGHPNGNAWGERTAEKFWFFLIIIPKNFLKVKSVITKINTERGRQVTFK
jgi:hypothetical protein